MYTNRLEYFDHILNGKGEETKQPSWEPMERFVSGNIEEPSSLDAEEAYGNIEGDNRYWRLKKQ